MNSKISRTNSEAKFGSNFGTSECNLKHSWTARILYYFYPFVIALCVDWVCNEHFLIVGIIKHWKSQCGKMQTWICHKSDTYRHMSEIGLDLHNFQTTVIFKISSFGNFVMVVLCYKALIACNKQWQKVYMPIRSQHTTWLPWRSILFCKHMHGFCTDYSGIVSKLMSSQRTIFNVCVCNVLGRLWAQVGHPGRISETSLPFVAQSVYLFSDLLLA